MIEFVLLSFVGYAFTVILMDDILFSYKKFLYSGKVPEWIAKPIGMCPVCFTGQLTFWVTLFFVDWNFMGILYWLSTISVNMIVVLILMKYVKGD